MSNVVGAAVVELAIDSSGAETGAQRTIDAVGRTGRSLATLGQQGATAFSGVGSGSAQAAARVDTAARSLIGSIQRTTAAMEAGSRGSREYFEALASQRGVNPAVLRPYLDALDQVNNRQRNVGASAAQVAAAMRQVPAQFTDIVTSLQGGQSPLTVLLQQGGQLRDSFGSTSAAARALSSYVVGLVGPYTLLAGAAAAVAVAYNEGSKEADGYRRSLVMSGNQAATTAGQMADMARSISQSVGTQGAAAEALVALAETGQVGAENLERFGLVAVEAQRAIGKSVQDTAKDFAELGKSPVQATERLNETYHYLTAAVYEQIKALESKGLMEEAASVAQKAYADAMDQRSKALTANLGSIEKAWKGTIDWAKKGWDAILDVGREDTLTEKLDSVKKKIQAAEIKQYNFIDGDVAKAQLVTLREQEASLRGQIQAQNDANAAKDASNKLEAARIAWLKDGEQYLTRQQQLDRDIIKTRNEGAAAGQSQAAIEARVGEVRKKYSDIYNAGIESQIELLKRREAIAEEVENRSKTLLELNHSAGLVDDKEYIQATAQLEQAALEQRKAGLQQELALMAAKQNSQKEQAALRGQIALVDQQIVSRQIQQEGELAALEVQRSRAAANAYADLLDKQTSVRDSLKDQLIAQRDANEQIGLSAEAVAELVAQRLEDRAATAEQNAELAESIDLTGAMSQAYREQAALLRDLASAKREGATKEVAVEAAKEAQQAWKRSAEQIENSIEDALMRGFESGKGAAENLVDTVENLFKTLVLKPTIQGIVSGSVGGGATSGAASALQTTSQLGNLYNTFANVGGTVSGIGNLFGSTYLSSLGAGLSGGANVGEAIAAYQAAAAAGVEGAATTASGLAMGSSISTALAAVPGWGWAAIGAAAIVGMSGLLGDGPESDTRLTFTSNNQPGQISINERGNEGKTTQSYIDGYSTGSFGSFGLSSTFWMNGGQDVVQNFIKTVTQVDDVLSGFLTDSEKQSVTSAVTGVSMTAHTGAEGANPNANGQFDQIFAQRLNTIFEGIEPGLSSLITGFKGTSQELATEAAAILQFRKELVSAGETIFGTTVSLEDLAALKEPSEATSAALARVATEFTVTNQVLDALGISSSQAFGAVGLASEEARKSLIAMAGGAETLASQSAYFTQNFLSKSEQLGPVQKQLTEQLSKLGYAGLSTAEQYKDAVLGLASSGALATESGRETYEALLSLAPAFKTVTDASNEAAKNQLALENKIFELTHTAAEVAARERQQELDATEASLKPLQERINALEAEKEAEDAATEAAQQRAAVEAEIASQRAALEDQLYELTHTAAEVAARKRQQELEATDASLQPLQERINALKDEKAAQEAAAQAAEQLAAAEAATATKRAALEDQIYELTHTAAEVVARKRQQELDATEASLQPLQERINALEDEKAAQEAAAEAAEKLASAEAATASKRAALQDQIFELTHTAAEVAAQKRQQELDATEESLKPLQQRINVLEEEKDALDAAAAAAQRRAALEDQIYELTHTAAEVAARKRQQELDATEESLKPLQERINALQAEKEAAEAAAATAEKRAVLEDRIYELTHTAAEVAARKRQQELEATEASLKPLQERINALEDERAAQEQANSAMQALGNALVENMQKAKDAAAALREYSAQLYVSEDSPLSNQEKLALAKQQFDSADNEHVQEASSSYLSVLKAVGVTGLEYAKAFAAIQSRVTAAASAYDNAALSIPAMWAALTKPAGSHASGLDSVPYDGYSAILHSGEKVLTSSEAGDYRGISKAIGAQNTLLERIASALDKVNSDTSFMATLLRGVAPDGRTVRTSSS